MKKTVKILLMTLALGVGFQGMGDLQAQMKKPSFKQPTFKQLPAAKNTKQLKTIRPGAVVSRGQNGRGLQSPNNVLTENDSLVTRLPDSRISPKEVPATPPAVLKKLVL